MNNLKKIFLVVFMLSAGVSFSQNKKDWQKIKTLKIAFITEQLDLTSKEAQEFWPIYNDFDSKKSELYKKEHHEIRSKVKEIDKLSENEAAKLLEKHLLYESEKRELDKSFIKKISKIISAKKTLLLIRSEDDFKKKLIKQYHDKNKGRK